MRIKWLNVPKDGRILFHNASSGSIISKNVHPFVWCGTYKKLDRGDYYSI
jgi:hypothetical protein